MCDNNLILHFWVLSRKKLPKATAVFLVSAPSICPSRHGTNRIPFEDFF